MIVIHYNNCLLKYVCFYSGSKTRCRKSTMKARNPNNGHVTYRTSQSQLARQSYVNVCVCVSVSTNLYITEYI